MHFPEMLKIPQNPVWMRLKICSPKKSFGKNLSQILARHIHWIPSNWTTHRAQKHQGHKAGIPFIG